MSARKSSAAWHPTSDSFAAKSPATASAAGCGPLPATRPRIISAAVPGSRSLAGAANTAISWPDCPLKLREVSSSCEPPADHALVRRAMEAVRAEVEPSTWQAFWRMTVEGHSSAEVARDLGLSPNAVRQAKYRLLRRLRQELDG